MGLQAISSKQWKMHFADFSQAFMQGDQLQREEPLFCEPPERETVWVYLQVALLKFVRQSMVWLMHHIVGINTWTKPRHSNHWVILLLYWIHVATCFIHFMRHHRESKRNLKE